MLTLLFRTQNIKIIFSLTSLVDVDMATEIIVFKQHGGQIGASFRVFAVIVEILTLMEDFS